MIILTVLLSLELSFLTLDFLNKRRFIQSIDTLSLKITDERLNKLEGFPSSLALENGNAVFFNGTKSEYFDLKGLRAYIPGINDILDFTGNFKIMSINYGYNGLTIEFKDGATLVGKLVFYVATSTFREEIY